MKLSNRAIYGLRAVFDLAYHGGDKAVQIREVAERAQVPLRFLEQIFQDLKRADLVESKRGPRGGYRLKMAPEDITLARVFAALEDLPEVPDFDEGQVQEATQVPDVVCREVFEKMCDLLASVTVADLMHRGEELGLQRTCYEGFVYVI
jgi:Rrf2 family transcriptional regulator, iron-sulfur cluster assembly transcription factor